MASGRTEGDGAEVGIIDRAAYNQGENALYDPKIETADASPSLVARGPHAVFKEGTARMTAFGQYEEDDTASTIKQRDHKDATDLVVNTVSAKWAKGTGGPSGDGTKRRWRRRD